MELARHPQVYEPAEDSWLLVKALKEHGSLSRTRLACDMGTGSGIVAIALAEAGARRILAVDLNPHAVRLARQNARANGVLHAVFPVRSDLFSAVCPDVRFDLLTFNAPYLPPDDWDEALGWVRRAFTGGPTGAETALRFIEHLPVRLRPGGAAFVVLSSRGEEEVVLARVLECHMDFSLVAEARFFFEQIRVYKVELRPAPA